LRGAADHVTVQTALEWYEVLDRLIVHNRTVRCARVRNKKVFGITKRSYGLHRVRFDQGGACR
jgi:hypothetical protein